MKEPFEQIVERLSHRVYTLARYSLRSAQDAEDVTQEVLIKLWENWKRLEMDRVEGWLVRVTGNACVDHHRRQATRRQLVGEGHDAAVARVCSDTRGPLQSVEASESRDHVLEAISRLTEPHRSALILREIEGLSYNEIAEHLELSLNSVKVLLYRARARFSELIHPVEQEACATQREANARVTS